MLISWIMIWPSAVMMDCSFSSSIWGMLALFSPCVSGKFWISCWCETTYMVYQGQYPLMSGPEPCQENLFSRFSLYVDSCCVGREQPASAPASMSSASVFDRVISSPLPCAQQELDLLSALPPFGIAVIVHDRARDTLDILFDNAKRICGVDKPLLSLFS